MERLANFQLVHGLFFLVLMLSMQSPTIAKVAVQDFDTHIKDAETVLTGMVREDRQGQVIFVVETSLKGAGKPNEKIIVDENSKLAWRLVEGGGMGPPTNYADFVRRIQQTDWYQKRVVLVGSIKDGKWISYCYDWSVWTSGASTRDETLKSLSFDELVEVLKLKIGKPEVVTQKKTTTQADKAETTGHATPAPKPPPAVQPKTPETPKSKPPTPPSSKEAASSTPWSIIVVLVVTATGLLWLLHKRRS